MNIKITDEIINWYATNGDDFVRVSLYPTAIINKEEQQTFFPLLREFEQLTNKKYTTKDDNRMLITYHRRLLQDILAVQVAFQQSEIFKQLKK